MLKRKEVSFYGEIIAALKEQMESIFKIKYPGKNLSVYFKTNTGEEGVRAENFKKGLQDLVEDYPEECECMIDYANDAPPLLLDIFFIVTNGEIYKVGIVEVKYVGTLGLSEYSQLIGYCIASNVELGILMNVDGGISKPLFDLTPPDSYLTKIKHIVGDKELYHEMAIMKWDSSVQDFSSFGNRGNFHSIEQLCDKIATFF